MNDLTYFDVSEFGKTVGWFLEPTEVWSYGEGCDCGCKFVAQSMHLRNDGNHEEQHFRTLKGVLRFFCKEGKTYTPIREPDMPYM